MTVYYEQRLGEATPAMVDPYCLKNGRSPSPSSTSVYTAATWRDALVGSPAHRWVRNRARRLQSAMILPRRKVQLAQTRHDVAFHPRLSSALSDYRIFRLLPRLYSNYDSPASCTGQMISVPSKWKRCRSRAGCIRSRIEADDSPRPSRLPRSRANTLAGQTICNIVLTFFSYSVLHES